MVVPEGGQEGRRQSVNWTTSRQAEGSSSGVPAHMIFSISRVTALVHSSRMAYCRVEQVSEEG